ncbi:class I SAM-dependent methyltransferase [Actinokineospora auranticolor]|uniref:Methyltransferase family protein n=1 Tax=Actinokineospora auranticolor TaxID=155976 RepID=A0A2S6GK66_9PSEU|nr:class I SAM-dependent methyltransferase [Actinokineospora auranticolor]PPK65580.1 methyltransferase family protein [Actinokineospora auranticolor]
MRRPQARATAANTRGYAGDEVAGYLRDRYHRLRVTLALDLLTEHLPAAATVLDLGAGGGEVCALLAGRGLRPVACDAVPAALHSGFPAVRLDVGEVLPFRDRAVAGIFAGEIIEHVYDPALLLGECHRVLRPGGVLVVTTPNLAPAQDRLRFLLGRAPRQVDPFHEYLRLHIRPFTYPLLATGMRSVGLVPGPPRSNQVVWRTRFGEARSTWLARVLPTLGGSLVVAAVRPS